ncbi:MAG: nucleotidyl transferase AbiEii/AbiGii toxin family protein [Verrucomicrobiales bacterium]
MDAFLQLSDKDRRLAFQQVESEMGLQAASVEKDFWVCWTLRELFRTPGIEGNVTFKGGTSLSKGWQLIERFSEDIDLVVSKEILGFGGNDAPEAAPSKKQRRKRLDGLMDACKTWVQETLQPALMERVEAELGSLDWRLEVDPDMADGQCLLFRYPSIFERDAAGYVRPVVKIEFGARSDDWPHVDRQIQPYVIECFPKLDPDANSTVSILAPERTFWEKACLLHEETFRPEGKPRKIRMARHYYDLWCLLRAGIGEKALTDFELFQRVAEHREIFFHYSWVDYSTHRPGQFRLVPPTDHLSDWRSDYKAMQGPMFFGDSPEFDDLLKVVAQFEKTFNSINDKSNE